MRRILLPFLLCAAPALAQEMDRQHPHDLFMGGLYAFDFAPASAAAPYGGGPHGAMVFVRLVAE